MLAEKTWHHVMLRICNQTAKIFVDGAEETSAILPENVVIRPQKARIGTYNSATSGATIYIDEFVFRHSAGTGTPAVPTSCYLPYAGSSVSKRDFGTIKSLLHFDYPYFNEPNKGLDDEAGIETWRAASSKIKLYGSAIPKAGTFTPKFGYICLYSYGGAVIGTNTSGIWNMNSSGDYEIEFFVSYPANGASTKHLFRLMADGASSPLLALSINNSGKLALTATGWGITETVSGTASLVGTWKHVLMRISGGNLTVYLNGAEDISAELPEDLTLAVSEARVGYFSSSSYPFYMDEFVFRHSAGAGEPAIPEHPYSGALDVNSVGGYGTGQDGVKAVREDTVINSYGAVSTVTDSKTFTVSEWSEGECLPSVGTEVMLHITRSISTNIAAYPEVGLYVFSRIASVNGNNVVLADEITEAGGYDFTLSASLLETYYVQAITVPNYQILAVSADATITPMTWSGSTGGGIIAFRVRGSCTVNGKILTHGYGAVRYDLHQMTHPKLIDRFLCSQGGGIFITCGGRFTASYNARLGSRGRYYDGAAGYGAKGGSFRDTKATNNTTRGGAGGVGGGGGGCCQSISGSFYEGAKAGSNAYTNDSYGGGGGGCNGTGYAIGGG